ncbi:MAG: hypothetical protein IPP19_11665 [Verrucomicrobia bacterium]|nr:hypothetical protein [Verrucomicrobiota bacterium]
MISKTLLAALIPLSFCCALLSQPVEPPAAGKVGLSITTSSAFSGKGDLKDDRATYNDISATQYSWAVNKHIAIGKKRRLNLGLDYDQTNIDKPATAQVPLPERLKSLGASLRYLHPLNQQWILSASVGAGSYVAESGLLSDGWGVRASVIGIYNHSRQFTFLFGLAHNSLSQDLIIVPVIGCDWRPTEKWSVAIGFPRMGVTYKLNKQVSLGFGLSGSGGAYYVKNDPQPGVAPRSLADSRLQHLEVRLGVNCDWKINGTFRVSATAGQVLLRRLKYIDHDYQLKSSGTAPFLSLAGTLSL